MPDATPPTDDGRGVSGPSGAHRADHSGGPRSEPVGPAEIGGPPSEPVGPAEAVGPLSLQRYRKRDGRQLILFARRPRGEREP